MFLARYADRQDAQGRHAVVRNGSLPEREVHTSIGAVRVMVPRVQDRSGTGLRFHSALLPPYVRRSQSLAALLPWLYLKGLSTGISPRRSRPSYTHSGELCIIFSHHTR